MLFLFSLFILICAVSCRDPLVLTPGGRLPSSCVHSVPEGSKISRNSLGRLEIHQTNGKFIREIPKCQMETPRIRKSIESRSKAKSLDNPFPSDYDGWPLYTAFNISGAFDTFLGDFSVPDAPANYPDILYIFTGLQNIDWIPLVDPANETTNNFDIIQPVLQYPADSGSGYSVKSWYVTLNDGAIYSPELPVNSGDVIFGNMTRFNETTWFVGSTSVAQQQTTSIVVNRPRLWPQQWAYLTLECYGCSGCGTYPTQPLVFSKLSLTVKGEHIEPKWKINPKKPINQFCKEKATINNDGTVDFNFQ